MTLRIPVLETERLILRAPREEDFEAFAAFAQSPRNVFVGGIAPRFDAWRGFLSGLGHWALRGYGFFVVEVRETGAVAGRVGLCYHDGWPEPEIGWIIFDGFEGHGYAHEAALAARGWAARALGMTRLISLIDPDNHRSEALARRLGAVPEADWTIEDKHVRIWRHPEVAP
ncbi:Protein N-acetyltransferase, RimJ/RimL family [Poseidonocella pacifica]|uniref:Protein N-acetyltransferase, RimJ/RimL family n=1 Tax=Poseidonocella pacifica TaxID=871651 RepID=A0A1I0Y1Z6_9RHOB|nr:GNAT family N-acetyltransferase [Poseidonocella pacifica]SFB07242.1 Protein N-acetyltransferase, RimJ/RimL family [Poseidonocella pacifica]